MHTAAFSEPCISSYHASQQEHLSMVAQTELDLTAVCCYSNKLPKREKIAASWIFMSIGNTGCRMAWIKFQK